MPHQARHREALAAVAQQAALALASAEVSRLLTAVVDETVFF
jgi:hypothetical protein